MASIIDDSMSICVDGRMLGTCTTGVGTYAETLVAALRCGSIHPLILSADRPVRSYRWHRARRWARAVRTGHRFARHEAQDKLSAESDLFREAQVFFNIHGRLMPVATNAPAGIMHWTYPVPLYLHGWRNVYTVHD